VRFAAITFCVASHRVFIIIAVYFFINSVRKVLDTPSCTDQDRKWKLWSFLLSSFFRTALGPTQPPIQWVPGAPSLGVKRPGREADHSPPSSVEVKECVELYLQYSFMEWCSAKKKAQGQLYLLSLSSFSDEPLQTVLCLKLIS
jgi:hypothetical protein